MAVMTSEKEAFNAARACLISSVVGVHAFTNVSAAFSKSKNAQAHRSLCVPVRRFGPKLASTIVLQLLAKALIA